MSKRRLLAVITYVFLLFSIVNIYSHGNWVWNLLSIVPVSLILLAKVAVFLANLRLANMKLVIASILGIIIFLPFADISLNIVPIKAASDAESLTLVSFNTEVWEQDVTRIVDLMNNNPADVYFLQEAFNNKFEFIDAQPELKSNFPDYSIVQFTDLVILSKFPIVSSEHSENYWVWGGWLRADLLVDEEIISAYNIHIPVPLNPGAILGPSVMISDLQNYDVARNQQVETLIKNIEVNENRIIVAGDFNSTKINDEIDYLSKRFNVMGYNLDLLPATLKFGPLKLWRIDWVFSDFSQLGYSQQSTQLSDHDLIEVELKIE